MRAPSENTREELLQASRACVAHVKTLCRHSLESCRRSSLLCRLGQEAFHRMQSRRLSHRAYSQSDG
jgi:hypothetical protein